MILDTETSYQDNEAFLADPDSEPTLPGSCPRHQKPAEPMHRRLERALHLNAAVNQLAQSTTEAGSKQAA